MRILLLGGSGFAGQNVQQAFRDTGHILLSQSRATGLDLTDQSATVAAFRDFAPDVVLNCAAVVGSLNYVTQKAAEVVDSNLRMILNVYRATQLAAPRAVVVNPVANCAFPGDLEVYREDDLWAGEPHQSVLSYGSTRRMMVVVSQCYGMQHGVRSVNLFVPNMYGPFDSTDPNKSHAMNALVSKLVKARAEGLSRFEVWGTGAPVREWLYAGDFARVLLETLGRIGTEPFDHPINIGQRHGWSVREIVDVLVDELGFTGEVAWDRTRPDGAPRKVMDDARFRKFFPDFAFTGLRDGIRKTIAYYESVYPY
jgi:GDP-L-fucose synthase